MGQTSKRKIKMDNNDEPIELGEVELITKTERAIRVYFIGDSYPDMWIPENAIHDNSDIWKGVKIGKIGKLVVFKWWVVYVSIFGKPL